MPAGGVARDLDIHPNLLHSWRRTFLAKGEKAFTGKGRIVPEKAEIRLLRKVGLSMGGKITQELASDALKDAVGRQGRPERLIHHSDRGRQCGSYAYRDLLQGYGMRPSMGRSGNCYDNAYLESFFGTLKTELVHGERYRTKLGARLSIFEYVEVFRLPKIISQRT